MGDIPEAEWKVFKKLHQQRLERYRVYYIVKHKSLIGAILGVVVTPLAVALALKSAGQGDFYWAGVFFPALTMLMLAGAGPLVVPLVLLQYPFYGWYTGRCISREHYIRLVVVLLLVQILPMLVAMFN